jgi:3-methylfumaryl-CoA hydratase
MNASHSEWVGRTELAEESIELGPARATAATLDDTTTRIAPGSPLPPLWHWAYFVPRVPQSGLADDGHPHRGGFLPPIELPRRMFAGARLRFVRPLIIGEAARRESEIRSVSEKAGRTGKLAFVTVGHRIVQGGEVCIHEENDLVYREAGAPIPAPEAREFPPLPERCWSRVVVPDSTVLFRYSAITFNAHRIHYDRDYATGVDGYPGLVVHGQLVAVLLMELVRSRSPRPVASFWFRARAPMFDGVPLRLVATPDGPRISLEAQRPDGETALLAEAELA